MNASSYAIPDREIGDYVELVFNVLCFCIGGCLNLLTLHRLLKRFRRAPNRLCLLHINLNISDLFVLILYSFGRICWMATISWEGGEILCRLMRFLEEFCFILSSNIMVCIGLDRLHFLNKPQGFTKDVSKGVIVMLLVAWTLALLCASPQLAVYTVFDLGNWTQCVSIYIIQSEVYNSTDYILQMKLYNLGHLAVVFWIPMIILFCSYVSIIRRIVGHLRCYRQSQANEDATVPNQDPTPESVPLRQSQFRSRLRTASTRFKFRPGSDCSKDSKRRDSSFLNRVSGQRMVERNRNVAVRSTLLLLVVYALCWLPYNSLSLWVSIGLQSYKSVEDYVAILFSLMVLNSVVNPFIYGRLHIRNSKKRRGKVQL